MLEETGGCAHDPLIFLINNLKKGVKMRLAQEEYVNENGHKVKADIIDCVTTYYHIADGFYEWECSECKEKNANRSCGWPIAGQVLVCPNCNNRNLLLTSSTDLSNKGQKFAIEYEGNKSVLEAFKKRAEDAEKFEIEFKKNLFRIIEKVKTMIFNSIDGDIKKFINDSKCINDKK